MVAQKRMLLLAHFFKQNENANRSRLSTFIQLQYCATKHARQRMREYLLERHQRLC